MLLSCSHTHERCYVDAVDNGDAVWHQGSAETSHKETEKWFIMPYLDRSDHGYGIYLWNKPFSLVNMKPTCLIFIQIEHIHGKVNLWVAHQSLPFPQLKHEAYSLSPWKCFTKFLLSSLPSRSSVHCWCNRVPMFAFVWWVPIDVKPFMFMTSHLLNMRHDEKKTCKDQGCVYIFAFC